MSTLFVIVPGIGGSELRDPEIEGDAGLVWWGDRSAAWNLVRHPHVMHRDRDLVPVGLLRSFGIVPWWKNIDPYGAVWSLFLAQIDRSELDDGDPEAPNLGARVVAFPYDFRLGVEHAADRLDEMLRPRLAHLGEETKVAFIAHSMGGLVARAWVIAHDGLDLCRGMVTLGTPHRGAPKALDVLVNGLRWGPFERSALSEVVRDWPGVTDLVGTGHRVEDRTTGGAMVSADQLRGLPHGVSDDLARAAVLHRDIEDGWKAIEPDRRPVVFPVNGIGNQTVCSTTWDGQRLRRSTAPLDGELRGDATVPGWSAVPFEVSGADGLSRVRSRFVRHGAMVGGADLGVMIRQLDGADPPTRGPDRPIRGLAEEGLGLDLDDLVEPGAVVTGAVLAEGFDIADGGAAVVAHLVAEGSPATRLDVDLAADGAFSFEVPPDVSGTVELRASMDRSERPRLEVSERVVVLS